MESVQYTHIFRAKMCVERLPDVSSEVETDLGDGGQFRPENWIKQNC